jgi:hypothetical protein
MSIQGTGHHILGGNFYNVGGDVNLHSHQHLTIQDHELHAAALGLTWSGGDGRAGGSYQQLMIQDHELDEPPVGSTSGFDAQAAGSEHEVAGVARNLRRGVAVRPAPYGTPKKSWIIFLYLIYTL